MRRVGRTILVLLVTGCCSGLRRRAGEQDAARAARGSPDRACSESAERRPGGTSAAGFRAHTRDALPRDRPLVGGCGERRGRRAAPSDDGPPLARRACDRGVRAAERERGAHDLPGPPHAARAGLQTRLVPRAAPDPPERDPRLDPCRGRASLLGRLPHRGRPLRPCGDGLQGRRGALRTRTAVGKPETPTPTGSFYVNQRLLTSDPSGPFGPGGIGISAFSPVLTGWAAGRSDRDPRDEPAREHRLRRLERLPADRERRARAVDPRDPGGDAGAHPHLRTVV